jgi:PAS domain S-box-containing protein
MPDHQKIRELRKEAERILQDREVFSNQSVVNEDMARLLEELSVHQIELEMQNDELQRSQQELERQKNKFIDLYENAPVAYITISPTGNIVSQNHKATAIFGSSSSGYNYISIFPYIDQSSKNDFRKMLKNAFIMQNEQQGEIRMKTMEKQVVHTEMHLTVYYDDDMDQDLCRITITNIENVRKVFNRKLEQSEEKYRELAENISEGIYLTENGYIKMVNTPACRLFGFEPHEMLERKVWEFVKPENQDNLRRLFVKKMQDMDGSPVDVECVRKDGSMFWAEISMRIIQDEKRVFGVISDITQRKTAEAALIRSEQRLDMALKGTKAGLWDWNIKSGDVVFDDRWLGMLGYSHEDIEPHVSSWEKLVHPDDKDEVDKLLDNHLEGRTEFYQSIHRLKAKDSTWKYILDSGMVIERNEKGEPLRAVGTHQDVTPQKEIEQELRALNATKDKLFSIIAHDLKSPYNAQLGFLELLLENENSYSEEQRKKFIHTVYNSTKQSFALLDNLLVWSRTQTGKIPFNPEELLLAQVFEEAIELHQFAAESKNILIDTELSHDNLEVSADSEMVNTILRNLLSNAIKFTPENGRIILGGKTANDNQTLIYVKDSGVGIEKENQHKLFDATSNFSTIGTNKEKGTGIGLIICRDFVERNKGKIWVDSEPGKGSTFYFTLQSFMPTKKCDSNCIQNFESVNQKIMENEELYKYFLNTIIPFFRHTYQKFSETEINCFIDELQALAKKHNISEFTVFANTIVKSVKNNDNNQINICFAEFERLTDELEIIATRES